MKTCSIRKTKAADWRFLAGLALVIFVVSGAIFFYAVRMQPPPFRQSENNDPAPPYFLSPASARPLPKTDKPSRSPTGSWRPHTAPRMLRGGTLASPSSRWLINLALESENPPVRRVYGFQSQVETG